MFPLKDDLPHDRAPIAWALAAAVLAIGVVRPLVGLLSAIVVVIAADGVARRGRPSLALLTAVAGAALTVGVALGAGDSRPPDAWNPLGPLAAVGAAAGLAGVYVGLAPTARVLTFSLLPGAGGMIAVPAALWTLAGIALIAVGEATHAVLPTGTGMVALVPLAALALGLLAGLPLRLLASGRTADAAAAGGQ
ncbi:hypothetical protein [Patulibacter defluvii]|uniref:hypothetical protein n=1 Tax=Patulibacter defluvii TaxID=3095358 RepID=UPI002A75F1F8|nr:hypothetical protein [Patulibacter sp. DM4]